MKLGMFGEDYEQRLGEIVSDKVNKRLIRKEIMPTYVKLMVLFEKEEPLAGT